MKNLVPVFVCGLVICLAGGCGVLRGQPDYVYVPQPEAETEIAADRDVQQDTTRRTQRTRRTPDPTAVTQPRVLPAAVEEERLPEGQDPAMPSAYRLRPGDPLMIQLRGIPKEDKFDLSVDDRGMINLPFIGSIAAAGKTASQLQEDIQREYLDQQIYRQITAIVIIPAQSYFMRGEVRQPGRYPKITGLTVLQAIASAGGYTEFANPRRITIIREGESITHNARDMERNPELDAEVEVGDIIIVPRSIF